MMHSLETLERINRPQAYPPQQDVDAAMRELTRCSCSLGSDASVRQYLAGRGLDADHMDDERLAFVLPKQRQEKRCKMLPGWAATWWPQYPLLTPLFDSVGALRSFRARSITPCEPKAKTPYGFACRGLVFANIEGRQMLRGEHAPERVLVAEGEPDFWSLATHFGDARESVPAVIGIFTGSRTQWTRRVPDGATVTLWTHNDDAGDRFADEIAKSLSGRRVILQRGQA